LHRHPRRRDARSGERRLRPRDILSELPINIQANLADSLARPKPDQS